MTSEWLGSVGPPSFSDAGGGREQEGLELRVGDIVGARSFLVSPDGWLHGTWVKKRWNPGVNTAQCWRPTGYRIPGIGIAHQVSEQRPGGVTPRWSYTVSDDTGEYEGYLSEKPEFVFGNQGNPDHKFRDCKCGLYGFFAGSMDYATDPRAISGIVHASGRVSLGSRGFRAEYAEIVAVYMPDRRLPRDVAVAPMHAGLRKAHIGREVTHEIRARVGANYPGIPIYDDLDRMLANHPTEAPS